MSARLGDLKRALSDLGISVIQPKKGSHWKAVGPGMKTEVSDVYLKGVCRCFGIDLDELKRKL